MVLLVLAAMALSACAGVAQAQAPTPTVPGGEMTQPPRQISVSGHGEVTVTPDIAYITIGVRTEGAVAATAVGENNANSQDVVDALKKAGVAEKDIRTSNFAIYPQQQYDDKGTLKETTYVVENTVYVTVRDLEKMGALLDSVVKSGANTINGIQFDLADKSEAMSEARKAAVADARKVAEELTAAAGVQLGMVVTINTNSSAAPFPIYRMNAAPMAAEAAVPISPGDMTVSVDVSLVYAIE
jgi:uncharacterized protein YggE